MYYHIQKHKSLILFIYFTLISGIISMAKGMDRSFDVRNYHIYNPYAFLNNRLSYDIMPADIQSYFNPILDIPYYLMVKYLNNYPYIVSFIQGLSYALLLFIIYKFSRLIFRGIHKNLLITLSILIGGTGALTLYNIGTLTHDIFVGDIILISLYLLIKTFDKYRTYNIIISGFLLGGICGLKLTAGIFAASIFFSLIFFKSKFKKPIKTLFVFCLSILTGFLITNGFWMYKLYSLFSNPFFPYFNNIFHSDYTNTQNMLKEDFLNLYPENVFEYLFFPFCFYQHLPTKGFELNYQDFRFAGIYIVFIINLLVFKLFNNITFEKAYSIDFSNINFLLTICVFTYIIWINTFATVRYLTPISAISGIIILASVIKFFSIIKEYFNLENQQINYKNINFSFNYKKTVLPIILVTVCGYIMLKTIEPDMLKRIPIKDKVLYIDNVNIPDNSVVITVSGCGITIPFQNPTARYIYLNAPRFTERNVNILSDKKQQEIKDLVKANPDKTYFIMDLAIYLKTFNLTKKALKEYTNINFDDSECKVIENNINNKRTSSFYLLCKANII